MGVNSDQLEEAAMIETLLHYTVFETLDTLGIYNFRASDIHTAKRHYMRMVTEADSIKEELATKPSQALSAGKDKKGLKKVRVNTKKMKQKKNPMTTGDFGTSSEE